MVKAHCGSGHVQRNSKLFMHSNNHAILPISAGIYICQMKRLGDNKTALGHNLTFSMHFETGPKFVPTLNIQFPQINGLGLIHKSAAGTELGAHYLRHRSYHPELWAGRACLGPDTGCQAQDKMLKSRKTILVKAAVTFLSSPKLGSIIITSWSIE